MCLDANGNPADYSAEEKASMLSSPSDSSQASTTNDNDDGGCSVTHKSAREVGPWLLALAVPAIILSMRKRPSSKNEGKQ